MINPRKYGEPPFGIVVVHGGPGAPGEMASVAREIGKTFSVLEPLQTAHSLEGQVVELKSILEKEAELPVVLIGHSWGAFLSFIVAAHYPSLVRKLILIGSGPFDAEYASSIMPTRLSRLDAIEKKEVDVLLGKLSDPQAQENDALLRRFGELLRKADRYDPIDAPNEILHVSARDFQNVWKEAERMRSSGALLALGKSIKCPVVAIHGNYDPHPAEGVEKPLSSVLENFKFMLLEKCGHDPWLERQAKDRFYEVLSRESG
jgi:pimeloyl-ACP methyl ester carboxylesterase